MTDPIKAEPVAWMYVHGAHHVVVPLTERTPDMIQRGWTETPLHTHAQLVEERRLAWNEAIEAAAKACEAETDYTTVTPYVHRARLAFVIHNLTKDSTHD